MMADDEMDKGWKLTQSLLKSSLEKLTAGPRPEAPNTVRTTCLTGFSVCLSEKHRKPCERASLESRCRP